MAYPVVNVAIASDTFRTWVERTNEMATLFRTEVVTANSLSTGAITTGNAFVNGIFSAQTMVAVGELRGGTVNASANLVISSNAIFTGPTINATANVRVVSSTLYTNVGTFSITGGVLTLTSNVNGSMANAYINATSMSVVGGDLVVTSNINATQANATFNSTLFNIVGANLASSSNLNFTGTVHSIGGNVAFDTSTLFVDSVNNKVGIGNTAPDAVLTVGGTANVSGAVRFANTLLVVGNVSLSNTLAVTGNVSLSNTLAVTGNVSLSNTLAVTGNATFSNVITVVGAATFNNSASIANTVTINTKHVIDVIANADLGSTTASPVTVYTFDPAVYKTAKVLAQVVSSDSANTQGNEMILTHNGTDSTVTIYGTVAAPAAANLGVFSTSINTTAVALRFQQAAASSKVTLVVHLIKA